MRSSHSSSTDRGPGGVIADETALGFFPADGRLALVPSPPLDRPARDRAVVRVLRVGFCGTDHDLILAAHAETPPGDDHLILGHEMVGVVEVAGEDVEHVRAGDVVVAAARRGCGRCPACRVQRADFCSGRYVEYGIHGRHGFARPRVEVEAENLVPMPAALWPLGVLAEPLGVVEKALEQVALVGRRTPGAPDGRPRTLVAGAGSLGLLAVFLLRQRGHDVVVFDRRPAAGRCGRLAVAAGARYHESLAGVREECGERGFDLVLEATGGAAVLLELLTLAAPNGIVVVLGVSKDRETVTMEMRSLIRRLVVRQILVLPIVNAGAMHIARAVEDLQSLSGVPDFGDIVTGVHRPEEFAAALRSEDGIKECLAYAAL